MILVIVVISLGCLGGAEPIGNTPDTGTSVFSLNLSEEVKDDLSIVCLMTTWLVLTLDLGANSIQFYYPERMLWVIRFIMEVHHYVEV